MKTCVKCFTEKPVTEYSTDKKSSDGFFSYCKQCQSAYMKAYMASRSEAKQSVVHQSKVCYDCGLEKPISQFGKKSTSLDKHNVYCKRCWYLRCKKSMEKANAKNR
jgi:hypothetical protein